MSMILEAFCQPTVLEAAHAFRNINVSVIPLRGKKPAIDEWEKYQSELASHDQITQWHKAGYLKNVGIVMGRVSCGLVCIDLDGDEAAKTFYKAFSGLWHSTINVLSGSHHGRHLYFFVDVAYGVIPKTTRIKGYELRAEGCYMVAPPSTHPETGLRYETRGIRPVNLVDSLEDVRVWLDARRPSKQGRREKYLTTTINNIVGSIARASVGERNNTLFNGACMLGQLVGSGELSRLDVEYELFYASRKCGLSEAEAQATIESGLTRGMQEPRQVPVGG